MAAERCLLITPPADSVANFFASTNIFRIDRPDAVTGSCGSGSMQCFGEFMGYVNNY
jgi:hypothetical protein